MSTTPDDPYFIESVPQYKDFLLEHDDTIGDRFFDLIDGLNSPEVKENIPLQRSHSTIAATRIPEKANNKIETLPVLQARRSRSFMRSGQPTVASVMAEKAAKTNAVEAKPIQQPPPHSRVLQAPVRQPRSSSYSLRSSAQPIVGSVTTEKAAKTNAVEAKPIQQPHSRTLQAPVCQPRSSLYASTRTDVKSSQNDKRQRSHSTIATRIAEKSSNKIETLPALQPRRSRSIIRSGQPTVASVMANKSTKTNVVEANPVKQPTPHAQELQARVCQSRTSLYDLRSSTRTDAKSSLGTQNEKRQRSHSTIATGGSNKTETLPALQPRRSRSIMRSGQPTVASVMAEKAAKTNAVESKPIQQAPPHSRVLQAPVRQPRSSSYSLRSSAQPIVGSVTTEKAAKTNAVEAKPIPAPHSRTLQAPVCQPRSSLYALRSSTRTDAKSSLGTQSDKKVPTNRASRPSLSTYMLPTRSSALKEARKSLMK